MKTPTSIFLLLLAFCALQPDLRAAGKGKNADDKEKTEEELKEQQQRGKGKNAGAQKSGGQNQQKQQQQNPARRQEDQPKKEKPVERRQPAPDRPKQPKSEERQKEQNVQREERQKEDNNRGNAGRDQNRNRDEEPGRKNKDTSDDAVNRGKGERERDRQNEGNADREKKKENGDQAADREKRGKDDQEKVADRNKDKEKDQEKVANRDKEKDQEKTNNRDDRDKVKVEGDKVKIDDRDKKVVDREKNVDNSRTKNVTNVNIDKRPGKADRPARAERRHEYNEVHQKNVQHWNTWKEKKVVHVEKFKEVRHEHWNNINVHYHEHGWAGHYHEPVYAAWRHNVWDYRRARAEEVWVHRGPRWDDCFDDHWWGYAAWRPRPRVYVDVSPWWWWQPLAWSHVNVFFGGSIAASPVVYDPGTSVIYEGDNYYVDGEVRGSARSARRAAIALAQPRVEEVPVPEPAERGQAETWEPLGVWALTQQEEGDANMFLQLSVNRDGLVAGAYKNVMTGDEQPVVGQLDKQKQVLAWHVGNADDTVYETGLSNLENDVASVFVHFGEEQTQTWLLVRLPSPELPASTVKIPDYVAQN